SEEGLEHEIATATTGHALGLPVATLDAKQLAAMETGLSRRAAGGVYFPMDAYLTPDRFMSALIERLRQRGVDLAWNTPVTGWNHGAGRINGMMTARGAVDADEFVICGGAWTAEIARQLKLRLPMQAGKGYS